MTQLLLEESIAIASDLKAHLHALTGIFAHMPTIVEREHAAIKRSDLEAVEKIAAEKNDLGDRLDSHFEEIKKVSHRLVMIYERISGQSITRLANLSECYELLQVVKDTCAKSGIGIEVMNHCLKGLKAGIEQFSETRKTSLPKIELNKVVLQKVLTNRQENYRFWQEVSEEMLASYDRSGLQKAKGQRSVLSVKA